MSDQDAYTPRVFLARHGRSPNRLVNVQTSIYTNTRNHLGETEWTKTGQYTGLSDLPLTSTGELQVISTGKHLVGTGKLIDPTKVAHIFVSPRQRAQKTFNLLFPDPTVTEGKTTHTEDIAEWSYGKYEGLLTKEIRAGRKDRGLDTEIEWDIWRDGCEDGESAEEVRERLDRLIGQIKDIQREHVRTRDPERMSDVVLVGGSFSKLTDSLFYTNI